MTQCQSITSIMKWANVREVSYVGGDSSMPYVFKDGLYHYFKQNESGEYSLIMTSLRDVADDVS